MTATTRHWWQRSLLRSSHVAIVPADQFVTLAKAQEVLGVRTKILLNLLVIEGDLKRAATGPGPWYSGDLGVTAESFAPVAEWWTSASPDERRHRFRHLNRWNLRRSI